MYQKQEIIIKKRNEDAENFCYEHISYYIDMENAMSAFKYPDIKDNKSLVTVSVTENDNEDEKTIVIEEFWDGEFMLNYAPAFLHGGGQNQNKSIPKALGEMLKMTECGNYLRNRYIENFEKLKNIIDYKCITRFFDNIGNGEGAIGIYNPGTNNYEKIGYGIANNGWSGEIIKDNVTDRSFLSNNPDKIWYSVNPMNSWYPLGPLDEDYADEWKKEFDTAFEKIPEKYRKMIKSDDQEYGCFEYNYADYDNYWACEWYFFENKDCNSPDDEIMKFTGNDILELISVCETFTEDFMKMQIHSCERVGADTEPILDDAWWCNMLFYNDDGEVLYISSEDDRDTNGRRTGKLTLHRKSTRD